jgi:hypothetical protein
MSTALFEGLFPLHVDIATLAALAHFHLLQTARYVETRSAYSCVNFFLPS